MLHPLFSTIVQRPDLVIDHLSAYGALARLEAGNAGSRFLIRMAMWALASFAGILFLIFAGIAVMLGFVHQQFHWVLIVVPGLTLAISVIAAMVAKKPFEGEHFPELRAQIDSDTEALRLVA